jgi:hypothetical protein
VGGNRAERAVGARRARATALIGLVALSALSVACSGGDATPSGDVDQAGAYTAIVEWQAAEQEPVLNDDGTVKLPVIYVVAADGKTIDVGVQASVAAATVDIADVRFADESAEAFDNGLDGAPVIDHGVMLLVGAIPDPAPTIDVDLLRYLDADTSSSFTMQITADDTDTESSGVGTATVTSATPT